MLDYEKVMAWRSPDVRHEYGAKDSILYALGLGLGTDPLDPAQLRFTYEDGLVAMPTMAAVLASPGFWVRDRPEFGIDYTKVVHGEQGVTLHSPLPAEGVVIGRSRVVGIADKGEAKGAVMQVHKDLVDEASGRLLASTLQTVFLRGDGGFSRGTGGDAPVAPLVATPATPPSVTIDLPTRPDAALLYRLSGDINPLHADPAFAKRAGFPRPILHGLATFGMAGWGVLKLFAEGEPARMKSLQARMSSPVFPGETMRVQGWALGDGEVAFSVRVVERDVVVLSHGRAGFAV